MNIDVTELKNGFTKKKDIDINYSFNKEELSNTDIRKLDNLKIKGSIEKNVLNEYVINIVVDGVMILPCSLTLKDVSFPFSFEINGDVDSLTDENLKKSENSIDIFPIIWENILMEIPMKVVSDDLSDLKKEGNGWKIITDESSNENINPELMKLKDLL